MGGCGDRGIHGYKGVLIEQTVWGGTEKGQETRTVFDGCGRQEAYAKRRCRGQLRQAFRAIRKADIEIDLKAGISGGNEAGVKGRGF